MMHSMLYTYNASSHLDISITDTFVVSTNARKVKSLGMVNPLWLNGMKTQGFASAKPITLFSGIQDQQHKIILYT